MITQRQVTEYQKLKEQIDEMEKKAKELRERLMAEVPADSEMQIGPYRLSVTTVEREDVDKKAALLALGDKLTPFLKRVEYPRLLIKRRA